MGTRDGKSFKLPHSVIVKAPGLLPMYYTATDLVDDLGVSRYVLRQWIENGLPYHRDSRKHIMIDGRELAQWVEKQRQLRKVSRLKPNQGFCLRCMKAVRITDRKKRRVRKRTVMRGHCEFCGAGISRGIRDG